ncbi:MAG: peptidase T [Ferruginibacter sp.]
MQFTIDQFELTDRFMRYVQIDTQSDPQSTANPSTEKQKNLSRLLCAELKQMGLEDVSTDDYGYVYATIPSNTDRADVPVIAFCSHVDTAPDCSGTGVKPILHEHYDGSDIVLPDDPTQVLRLSASPYLKQHIGSGIITASGSTLLGADDKSGVAIIMQAMQTLLANPSIKHGTIKVVFTPDEEVGRGTEKIDLQKLGAKVGYTLDGGEAGTLEDESFSADAAQIIVHGVSVHPGYAKGVLVNAIKVAGAILDALPKTAWSPETTEGRDGFVHPVSVQGISEKTTIGFIVRDFTNEGLRVHHERLKALAASVVSQFPGASFDYVEQEQYRNMKSVLDQHPKVKQLAERAIEKAGLTVSCEPIRGGTDGSRLSFMGLPTLNLFTGMQNIHGKLEWVGVKDMVKAVETIVYLCNLWETEA